MEKRRSVTAPAAARARLRDKVKDARSVLDQLKRLKLVLPMVEGQRAHIDAAIKLIEFAWRHYKLESKIGDTLSLSDYAGIVLRTRLPKMSWREVTGNKSRRKARA